jgi:dTDP-4-amino-4,6-dideoxygalactose transaminase
MTELEAAVAIEQFKKLDFMNDHRIELAEYLTERLLMFDDLILPQIDHADKHVYFVYPIRIKVDILGVSRDIIVKALQAEGIPFGGGYVKPIYLEPLYQKKIAYGRDGCPFTCKFFNGEVDYHKGICPVAEEMYEKELMLTPVCKYPHSKADIDSVVEGFEKVFDNLEALKDFAE